ncbi:MAG: hypothetical protein MHPSP_004545, partial [Paramarteilia canceri]
DSSDQNELYSEIFELFSAKDAQDKISTDALGTCLKTCGFAPSLAQIESFKETYDPKSSGYLNLDNFNKICKEFSSKLSPYDTLIQSFKVFDPENTGMISETLLKKVLTGYGEKISENDLDEFFNILNFNEKNETEYSKICELLTKQ